MKAIMKCRGEINKIENRKKINEAKGQFFERSTKLRNPQIK